MRTRMAGGWAAACALLCGGLWAQSPPVISIVAGQGTLIDLSSAVERVVISAPEIAEALPVTSRELLINGKSPGETSLMIWQQGGNRRVFTLRVVPNSSRSAAIQHELDREFGARRVTAAVEGGDVFLRGTVEDLAQAQRAVLIASTLGKTVNLMKVKVPEAEPQILLKVRFANVDRAATKEMAANFLSTGLGNTVGALSTQQFSPPGLASVRNDEESSFKLTDLLNVFLFRKDLNLGATLKLLESRRLLQVLAEPNLLTLNGKEASFLAGGEFPFPTLQGGGAGLGAVTIQFREFGVRITFTPFITARGSIRLQVTPEVSALDFANGLVFQGFTIPGLNSRRVTTEVELDDGQSFAIAGLLDNRTTEALSKVPGLGNVPILGKLFQSKLRSSNNTELLVLVTPELVRPVEKGRALPEVKLPRPAMQESAKEAPRTLAADPAKPVAGKPKARDLPVEKLLELENSGRRPAETQKTGAPGPLAPAGSEGGAVRKN